MKLSRTVTYALKATIQLAQNTNSGPIPCSRLASQGGMPERFLLQILRSLVTHGILKSTRGVDGGYVLFKQPEEVSLLDVIEAIEGPMTHDVVIGEGLPNNSRIRLSNVLEQVTDATLEKLSAVRLADLVAKPEEMDPTCQPASIDATVSRVDQPLSSTPAVPPPVVTTNHDDGRPTTALRPVEANSGAGV